MRPGAGLLTWLCVAACAPALGASQEPLRLISSVRDCEFGQPFVLTVERAWPVGAAEPAWDPTQLAPLELEWESSDRQTDGGWLREVQRFRARSFTVGTFSFPPHFDLTVRSSLRPDDGGQLEPPARASASRTWIWFSLLALGCGVFALLRARRTSPPGPAASPVPSTVGERLQQLQPAAAEFPAQLTAVLRDWLAERAGLRAPGRLVEEFLTDDSDLAPATRAEVQKIVRSCEESRFAGAAWSLEQRNEALAATRALVGERP